MQLIVALRCLVVLLIDATLASHVNGSYAQLLANAKVASKIVLHRIEKLQHRRCTASLTLNGTTVGNANGSQMGERGRWVAMYKPGLQSNGELAWRQSAVWHLDQEIGRLGRVPHTEHVRVALPSFVRAACSHSTDASITTWLRHCSGPVHLRTELGRIISSTSHRSGHSEPPINV